jgi:hypothetical protein
MVLSRPSDNNSAFQLIHWQLFLLVLEAAVANWKDLNMLKFFNLLLLVLFPVSWFAPLLHASLLPLFGLSKITILSGLQSLWASDVVLALIVTFFCTFHSSFKNPSNSSC